jgi:hypothetical protein
MTVSIESKAFQDTLSEMLTLSNNPDFKGNIELQDQFLTAKGFDPTEFMAAVDHF